MTFLGMCVGLFSKIIVLGAVVIPRWKKYYSLFVGAHSPPFAKLREHPRYDEQAHRMQYFEGHQLQTASG